MAGTQWSGARRRERNADHKVRRVGATGGARKEAGVADDETAKRLYAKPATVCNMDQVDVPAKVRAELLPADVPRSDLTVRVAQADSFIAATKAEYREGGQRAFYRHRTLSGEGDFMQMPPRHMFTGTETTTPTGAYESTRLHELSHWSGAAHRLARQHGERFRDHADTFEELVAELSAAFLCAEFEITNVPRPDHAQYIASWITVLRNDTRAIFRAAAAASTAVTYLAGLQSATPDRPVVTDSSIPEISRNEPP